jgi:polyhydroxybutyrate depolymerase
VHVPAGTTGVDPKMLVFVFHGFTETLAQIADISGMNAKADASGFLVVYPQGVGTNWNAGKCCGASTGTVDDVGFFDAMVTAIGTEHCVDSKRIHAAGLSNGAMFAHRLACERAGTVAAIAPVAGPLMLDGCVPSRAVPVLAFHGTADPVVPYDGGGVSLAGAEKDTISFWEKTDACTDAAESVAYTKGDATCAGKTKCAGGAAVELCTITLGGHQWPGGTTAGPYGTLSMDIDASAAMVSFFQAHPLP